MGRYSTGAITTNSATRIELSYLLKNGHIQKDRRVSGQLTWTDDSSIGFESYYTENDSYIRLKYNNTSYSNGEVTKHDYKIQLTTIPSNLGKGEVLYFVCPVTWKKCRILYNCYGSLIWKSREAYQNRIYYQTQLDPKSIRPFKHFFTDNKISELYQKAKKSHYRGKPTKLMQRINELNRLHDAAMVNYDRFERLLCGIKS